MNAADSDNELDYKSVDVATAGEQLYVMIATLKLQGTLSATQACLLAFWAVKAEAKGPISDIAMKPGSASGEYSRCFDRAV